MAEISSVEVHFAEGVRINSRQKTLLDGFPPYLPADMPLSKLGCYKAHSNAWRSTLAAADADTTLILEDDADWDIT